ncbi:hypothetical protein H9P43_002997 [Blastocladiella emersonii ATCC 22665]|nr:hypothetical protein H9P43_002997 [Blastocladiella emersonii ATCC 22665]
MSPQAQGAGGANGTDAGAAAPGAGPAAKGPTGIMDHQTFDVARFPPGMIEAQETVTYPEEYTTRPVIPGELDHERLSITFGLGFPALLRDSFAFVSSCIIVYPVGNVVMLLNTLTQEQHILPGLRCGGICVVAVHPAGTHIAVAEKHVQGPNICIYTYPEIRLFRVLRGGADLGFSNLSFSIADGGAKLASVASEPDFTLTVWDWRHEAVVLRAKAFSQDIFRVAFSPTNALALVTSGMGHIKFWKMASTFTGLKLQGTLGKFGATELTDIPCFAFLPSGKLLSGTETGNLLLWDGNFIQCEVAGRLGKKCHQGAVEFVMVDDGEVITAGEDGYIRTWDLEAIEGPEPNMEGKSATATVVYELDPLDEYSVGKDVKIKSMQRVRGDAAGAAKSAGGGGKAGLSSGPSSAGARLPAAGSGAGDTAGPSQEYIIVDSNGALWRADLKTRISERICSFYGPSITAIDTCASAVHHLVLSVGTDGALRVTDPLTRSVLATARHGVAGTCVRYLPRALDTLGCSLVAGFADGSVRFFRHAVPTPGKASVVMARTHAFRPHKDAVIGMAFSSDATVFTTATATGEVFFFSVRSVGVTFDRTTLILPVGFLALNQPIRSLSWALDATVKSTSNRIRGRYLVVTDEGKVATLQVNLEKQYEREHNFVIPASDYEVAPWSMQKYLDPVVVVAQPVAAPGGSADAGATAAGAQQQSQASSDQSGDDKAKDAAAQKPAAPQVTYRVTHVQYIEQDHFLASIECSNGTTEIRACLLSDGKISRLLLTLHNFTEISALSLSPSGKLVLLGCADGTLYHRPVTFDGDLTLGNTGGHEAHVFADEYFWRAHLHSAPAAGVRATFDDAIILSAGRDGVLFVLKSASDDLVQRALSTDGMLLPALEDADDLANKYTIQEAKMMLRIDEENALAEQRKQARLATVKELQKRFETLLGDQRALPDAYRLPDDAFHIDPGLEERIAMETKAKVEKAQNQLLWQSEKISLLLQKLKRRFHDSLLSHTVTVDAFNSGLSLCSFRTERIDIPELQTQGAQDAAKAAGPQAATPAMNGEAKDPSALTEAKSIPRGGPSVAADVQAGGTKASQAQKPAPQPPMDQAARLEDRRRVKAERQEQWKQLMAAKPSPTSEDPRDSAAIRYAETHMGDYKLKRDKNYIVPENERVNAEMKHKQIALLQGSLVRIMESYNGKVRALVQRKATIRRDITERNARIRALEDELAHLGIVLEASRVHVFAEDKVPCVNFVPEYVENPDDLSPQEQLERSMRIKRYEHELDRLVKFNRDDVERFDKTLESLAQERLSVAADVKSGEIRLLLLYREWKLLKEFEKHDTRLSEKLGLKRSEKADIDVKIREIQSKITEKRTEIEKAADSRKALDAKLAEVVSDSSKFEEILVKIFRKKVKHKRRKETLAKAADGEAGPGVPGGEEDAVDSEEESESEEDDDDDDSGDEAVSDECPGGCDAAVHKAVLDLREQRLDLEETLADVQKGVEALKKDHDIFAKKEKVIAAALKQTEQEIQEFQSQKQQKLNELDVVVPLAFHQIQFFEKNIDDALVFPGDGLDKLRHRIHETEDETEQVRKDHKELKREHVNLLGIRKEKRSKLRDLESKCAEVQMLKFGRLVDVDRLEKMGINKAAEDLRTQITAKERQNATELERWDRKLAQMKKELTASTVDNTRKLEAIYELSERRKNLELALDAEQEAVTAEYGGPAKQDVAERVRLIETVQRQAEGIEDLKIELSNLLRKPGPPLPLPPRKRPERRAPRGANEPEPAL